MKTTIRKTYRATSDFIRVLSKKESGLISVFIALFAVSSLFLSFSVSRDLDPDNGKNWWAIGFDDPKSASLSFFIDNHADGTPFSYVISQGKTVIDSGTRDIGKGHTEHIDVPAAENPGKTTITVTDKTGKKQALYRQ